MACRAAWDVLDADEQAVWLAYLDLKGYNTADPYLVVNEFQSYLFQQERAEVPDFQAITLQRVRDAFPALGPVVQRVEAEYPGSVPRLLRRARQGARRSGRTSRRARAGSAPHDPLTPTAVCEFVDFP